MIINAIGTEEFSFGLNLDIQLKYIKYSLYEIKFSFFFSNN